MDDSRAKNTTPNRAHFEVSVGAYLPLGVRSIPFWLGVTKILSVASNTFATASHMMVI